MNIDFYSPDGGKVTRSMSDLHSADDISKALRDADGRPAQVSAAAPDRPSPADPAALRERWEQHLASATKAVTKAEAALVRARRKAEAADAAWAAAHTHPLFEAVMLRGRGSTPEELEVVNAARAMDKAHKAVRAAESKLQCEQHAVDQARRHLTRYA